MRFLKPFYKSEKLPSDRKIRRCLGKKKPVAGLYLVTLSEKDDELFSIYSDLEFLHYPMKDSDVSVVGFAAGISRAQEMVRVIVDDVMSETGEISRKTVLSYFSAEDKEEK